MKYHMPEKYTAWNFAVDCFMIWLTKGLWLVWIIIRELRRIY